MQVFQKKYSGTCEIINLKTKWVLQFQRPGLYMESVLKLGKTAILIF